MKKQPKLKDQVWRHVCHFPATKSTDGLIDVEGELERDYCYVLEFDKQVVFYEPQPASIPYFYNGKERHYTADFRVVYENKVVEYVEVKYREFLTEKVRHQLDAIKEVLEARGLSHETVTEEEIRREPYYSNIKSLYHSNLVDVSNETLHSIKSFIASNKSPATIEELLDIAKPDAGIGVIHRLLYDGTLKTDLKKYFLELSCPIWMDNYV